MLLEVVPELALLLPPALDAKTPARDTAELEAWAEAEAEEEEAPPPPVRPALRAPSAATAAAPEGEVVMSPPSSFTAEPTPPSSKSCPPRARCRGEEPSGEKGSSEASSLIESIS